MRLFLATFDFPMCIITLLRPKWSQFLLKVNEGVKEQDGSAAAQTPLLEREYGP